MEQVIIAQLKAKDLSSYSPKAESLLSYSPGQRPGN